MSIMANALFYLKNLNNGTITYECLWMSHFSVTTLKGYPDEDQRAISHDKSIIGL